MTETNDGIFTKRDWKDDHRWPGLRQWVIPDRFSKPYPSLFIEKYPHERTYRLTRYESMEDEFTDARFPSLKAAKTAYLVVMAS